jgi:hypothetical protein
MKSTQFHCVCKLNGSKTVYAVGSDRTIKEIEKGKEKHKYDAGVVLS